jgi:alpha/beta superfamily hydrolase
VLVDLVQTTTRDSVRLDGIWQAADVSPAVGLDACCVLHGTGGNFYGSSLFDALAERLLALGCGVLRVNTRGHDVVSNAQTAKGGRRLGAAYEAVEDCRHDVAGWLDWLRAKGMRRVGLLGHSSGAVKAIYAATHEPQLDPVSLIAVSPPRLSYSWFCSSPEGPQFLATYQEAERLVEAGQAGQLIEVKLPLPFIVTAAGYLEKYGPDERYNYLKFVAGVRCPTLVTLGSVEAENNMAFRGSAEELRGLAGKHRQLAVEVVEGADHFYSGVRERLIEAAEGWLKKIHESTRIDTNDPH